MKKFLIHFSVFLIIWLFISHIADCHLTKKIRQSKSRAIAIWEDIFSSNIKANLIILGSSRACDNYNPRIFDSVLNVYSYNLGMQGSKIDKEVMRYNCYINHGNSTPSYIIWDLHYCSLDFSDRVYDYQFAPYLFDNDIWNLVHNRRHRFSFFDRAIPLLKYYKNKEIIGYSTTNSHYWEGAYKGYLPKTQRWNPNNLRKQKNGSIQCVLNNEMKDLFYKTIEKMQKSGSMVFFVFSPMYIEGQKKINGLYNLLQSYQVIADEKNCYFINYANDSICYDTNYFADGMHLNSFGADVFSKKLSNTLDSIIFQHRQ